MTASPATDGRVQAEIRSRLDRVLQGLDAPDAGAVGLIAILQATDTLRKAFPAWDRRQLKARVKELSAGDWASKAVKDAIEEMEAAMMAAITASIAATTST